MVQGESSKILSVATLLTSASFDGDRLKLPRDASLSLEGVRGVTRIERMVAALAAFGAEHTLIAGQSCMTEKAVAFSAFDLARVARPERRTLKAVLPVLEIAAEAVDNDGTREIPAAVYTDHRNLLNGSLAGKPAGSSSLIRRTLRASRHTATPS
jgi:hypothetical protein